MRPIRLLLAAGLAAAVLASAAFAAEIRYRYDMTAEQAQFFFDTMTKKGWHYRHLDTVATPEGTRYAMIFADEPSPRFLARAGLSMNDFQAAFDAAVADKMRMTDLSAADANGGGEYGAIWEQTDGRAWVSRSALTIAQFQTLFNEQTGAGMRLTDIDCYQSDGALYYAGTFERIASPSWYAFADMTPQQSQARFDEMVAKGYRPVKLSVCASPNGPRYAEIFEKSPAAGWVSKSGLPKAQFQAAAAQNEGAGMALLDISVYLDGGEARYAAIWVK